MQARTSQYFDWIGLPMCAHNREVLPQLLVKLSALACELDRFVSFELSSFFSITGHYFVFNLVQGSIEKAKAELQKQIDLLPKYGLLLNYLVTHLLERREKDSVSLVLDCNLEFLLHENQDIAVTLRCFS
nr:hypothetical protein CFP56_32017 [Quercus suber]